MLSKEEIRAAVKERREGLDLDWIREAGRAVQERVMQLPEFDAAAAVGCYMAMAVEVQTGMLLQRCHDGGKKVCVPARCPESNSYRLAVLRDGAELAPGCWGIDEPVDREWVSASELDCVLVPGVGFDPAGGRVGYGGGNYDRILAPVAGRAGCHKIGLAFGFQLFDRVPVDDNDILMDAIVTEEHILRVATRSNG